MRLVVTPFDPADEAAEVVGFDEHRNRRDARRAGPERRVKIIRLNAAERDDRDAQLFSDFLQGGEADRRAVHLLAFGLKDWAEDDEVSAVTFRRARFIEVVR